MPFSYQSSSVRPSDGGDLITQLSKEQVGAANYVQKLDWRREYDREVRREGHRFFKPNIDLALGEQPYPDGISGDEITLIQTARRPNGVTRTFAATVEKIFIYDSDDSDTVYEQTGSDAPVYEISGTDAPVYMTVTPGTWTTVGSGFSTNGHRWEMVNPAGEVIFNNGYDLPVMYDWDARVVHPMYELREQGVALAGTIAEFNGMLVLADIAEIRDTSFVAWMNGSDPYGPYIDSSTYNRIRYRIIWSSIGEPWRFGASVPVTASSGSAVLTLAYPISSLSVGDSVTVIGAGASGAELVADVIAISGTSVTVSIAAGTSVSSDLFQTIVSALTTGGADLQDDSTGILRMIELKSRLVVFKESGVFSGRFTAIADQMIEFSRTYIGPRSLFWRWTLTKVNGETLMFAGRSKFYEYDDVSQSPRESPKLSLCDNLFFFGADASEMDERFAAENQITHEVWFFWPLPAGQDEEDYPVKALAYDYLFNTCSEIGYRYSAAGTIQKPKLQVEGEINFNWFVMSEGPTLWQYYKETPGDAGWTRDGNAYDSILKSGLASAGDDFNEKDLRSYVVCLSEPVAGDLEITLLSSRNPSEAPASLFVQTITNPGTQNLIPTWFRQNYFQDQVRVTGQTTNYSLTRRVFEYSSVKSKSVIRNP